MADVKALGEFEKGQEVLIGRTHYIVDDIRKDVNGNLQVTFRRLVAKR